MNKREVKIESGYVYAITNTGAFDGWVKIGKAKDVIVRLNSYQTSDPYRNYTLNKHYKVEDYSKFEKVLHIRLRELGYTNKGEWFDIRCLHILDEIVSTIRDMVDVYVLPISHKIKKGEDETKYLGNKVSLVIETLQRCIPTSTGSLSIKDMRTYSGITSDTWGNMKNGVHFTDNLLKAGYVLTNVEGHRYKHFKKEGE